MTAAVICVAAGGLATLGLCCWLVAKNHKYSDARIRRGEVWHASPQLSQAHTWVKCPHCSGGTQHLNGENGWGKIPQHLLMHEVLPDGDCEHRLATPNVRKCPHCAGLGGIHRAKA